MAAWLYRRRDSGKFWIGWRANGKQFLKSTGTANEADAKAQLRRQEAISQASEDGRLTAAVIESYSTKPVFRITLDQAFSEWLDEARGSTAPRTWGKYELVRKEFTEYLSAGPDGPLLRDLDTDTIRAFLTKKRATLAATSVNHYRRILSTFLQRCVRNRMLPGNPMVPIQKFKGGRDEERARRAFTLEEVRTMVQKAPDDFWRYMLLMGFYTGQRLGDLICLRWGSVDLEQGLIRLTTSKTGRALQIPMAAPLRAILERLKEQAGTVKASAYLWPEKAEAYQKSGSGQFSNQFFDEVLTPAGLVTARKGHRKAKQGRDSKREAPSVSFHCLRHTFVSMLKLAGGSQAVVKELAGHTSDAVSDHYTHTGSDAMASAIKQLPEVTQ